MLFIDRVYCNFCYGYVGQMFGRPAQSSDGLEDLTKPPHFVVCHECWSTSEVFQAEPIAITERAI